MASSGLHYNVDLLPTLVDMIGGVPEFKPNRVVVMAEGGPFHTQGYLKKYCTHLEETGRGDLAEKLKAKYPEALKDNY